MNTFYVRILCLGLCSACTSDCNDCIKAYDSLITHNQSCLQDSDCHILTGHCGSALGGCYMATNRDVQQPDFDALNDKWLSKGCETARPVCACLAPPTDAICEDNVCILPEIE